jgi:hypothetical protein
LANASIAVPTPFFIAQAGQSAMLATISLGAASNRKREKSRRIPAKWTLDRRSDCRLLIANTAATAE